MSEKNISFYAATNHTKKGITKIIQYDKQDRGRERVLMHMTGKHNQDIVIASN